MVTAQRNLQQSLSQLSKIQNTAGTLKRIDQPSDDPSAPPTRCASAPSRHRPRSTPATSTTATRG